MQTPEREKPMLDSLLSWLVRRPALIDSAGAPVLSTLPPILLIDPHTTRADQIGMLLDHPVQHIAGDVVAALVALALQTPQLVLLVHAPPALDGVAFCRTIRAASNVPIILLVAVPGGADRARALRAGADDTVPLPVAPAELQARIAAIVY